MATRKLYSRRGTLLGTVTYPNSWDEEFRWRGSVRFHVLPPMLSILDPLEITEAVHRAGTLYPAYEERGAVTLYGMTPEEFEQIPGCSFTPSAAYLRSLLEG